MTAKHQLEPINLYAGIMEEVKIRLSVLDRIITNAAAFPPPIVRELGFLQLRMICELVALGCLVAHGNIKGAKSAELTKAYAADKIMKALDELHPNFYPVPFDQVQTGNGFELKEKAVPFMTKAELVQLVHRCGGAVHRGNLRNLLKPRSPIQKNFPELVEPANLLVRLLEHHRMRLIDGTTMLCMLQNENDDLRVQVALATDSEPAKV